MTSKCIDHCLSCSTFFLTPLFTIVHIALGTQWNKRMTYIKSFSCVPCGCLCYDLYSGYLFFTSTIVTFFPHTLTRFFIPPNLYWYQIYFLSFIYFPRLIPPPHPTLLIYPYHPSATLSSPSPRPPQSVPPPHTPYPNQHEFHKLVPRVSRPWGTCLLSSPRLPSTSTNAFPQHSSSFIFSRRRNMNAQMLKSFRLGS